MTFVPPEFVIPTQYATARCRVRPLTIHDVIRDYDAVMSSIEHLQRSLGLEHGWPTEDLTIEQNLIDLGWHHKEFERRTSFAYAVMDLSEQIELGCVYINPSPVTRFDAMVYMWVRADQMSEGLDEYLEAAVRDWITLSWPFRAVAYPGRDFTWTEWRQWTAVG